MSDQLPGVDSQEVIGEQAALSTKSDKEQQQAAQEYNHGKSKARPNVRVKVYSPFRDYYDGLALSLTAENATGPFDILPGHHNFISLLSPCDLIVRTVDQGDQRIRISGGIIHVKADEVIVFLDV